ncbi:UxaA family hydrolase [Planococcus beigongshangi]|uniref:UxaA family hydrolase n=1 Tax=Planococcus beigongshangi TaxID=2782536 RepID=UPI00193B662E|nr:UxaA family hydrolase [Planococcus beigongshangi]
MKYFFNGFRRNDGSAGTRNYVGIVSSVICSSAVVREISEKVDGTVPFVHANGCAQLGDDLKLTKNMLVGVTTNPNIHSALIVGLGCETNQVSGMLKSIPKTKPITGIGIQQLFGGENTINKGVSITKEWVEAAAKQKREKIPLSSLTIGVLAVEHDDHSLATTTSVIGQVVDELVDSQVNVIFGMSKTLEPAGDMLAERISDADEKKKLIDASKGLERLRWSDAQLGSKTFSEFTDEQLHSAKLEAKMAGKKPISSVLDFGEIPNKNGLHLMRNSSNLVESLSKMAAAGCSAVIIVSSRGVLTGSVALPCITITPETDPNSFDELVDYTIKNNGNNDYKEEIIALLQEVCSGKKTKLEELELGEFSIPHLGTTY